MVGRPGPLGHTEGRLGLIQPRPGGQRDDTGQNNARDPLPGRSRWSKNTALPSGGHAKLGRGEAV